MVTKTLSSSDITQAASILHSGELVALPTETVYGLAADACNVEAIKKVFIAKGRPEEHPLIVHLASESALQKWACDISPDAKKLAEKFWPGPLTMIFKKKEHVSLLITGGIDTVAIRVSSHPVIIAVLEHLPSGAVVAPSANFHKKISPTQANHVLKTLSNRIAAVVDAGPSVIGIESTIIDMSKEIPTILRYGVITKRMIEEILEKKVNAPLSHTEKVSGNMNNHYQPEKPLYILSKEEIEQALDSEKHIAIMHISPIKKLHDVEYYLMPGDKNLYAQALYEKLHQIDSTDALKILVERPPQTIEWLDILDRLTKASFK